MSESFEAERQMRRMSRRSFLWGAAACAGVVGGVRWLAHRPDADGIPAPLRRTLEFDEALSRAYFRPTRLAEEFDRRQAGEPRPNGDIGLGDDFDASTWKLMIEGVRGASGAVAVTLEEIQALPKHDIVTELKCIEGWSQVVHWTGARLADLVAKHPPATRSGLPVDVAARPDDLPEYMSIETPDGGYYVGLDMASALQPQTLLCYAMNGAPLTDDHGAPLRLAIPVKYGIKNIKRIGTIRYTSARPADYWAEQGYDWYAGH